MNITALLLIIALILIPLELFLVWWLLKISKKTSNFTITHSKPNQDEMTQILIHDLRAPVVAIKNSASLLRSGALEPQDEKDMLNLIYDQSEKLLFDIATILDAAKANQGKLTLKKELADLGSLIKEELKLFESEAKNKNITVTAEIASGIPKIAFDKIRIAEALNNILSNSLKYTNDNGLIKIMLKPKGQNVSLIVSDNGIGIPADRQGELFKKYSELATNNKNRKISSGLGLYITKWIIETHGGTIKMESEEGKGTTTIVTLPMLTKTS